MPNIQFSTKVKTVYNVDESVAWRYVKVPAITRSHCDMHAFRSHPRFSATANSDLFPAVIKRALAAIKVKETIRLDQVPSGVTIDESGFLALVTITLDTY